MLNKVRQPQLTMWGFLMRTRAGEGSNHSCSKAVFRNDRGGRKGEGIRVLIKEDIIATEKKDIL